MPLPRALPPARRGLALPGARSRAALPRCRGLAGGGGTRRLGTPSCGPAALLPTLLRGSPGLLLAPAGAALLSSAGLLVHRRPGPPGRFLPRDASLLVALLDVPCPPLLLRRIG